MELVQGMIDGIPIAMGYYAVAFSLGIIAGRAGIDAFAGFVGSWLTRASAGEYGVYSLVAINAAYVEVLGITVVANLRYMLMSTALTQKFSEDVSLLKRFIAACCMTDEIFGISIARKGNLAVSYPVGATIVAATAWAAGTATGILAANASFVPHNIVVAMSVALYGMFIAIIVPPSKADKGVLLAVVCSFILSGFFAFAPYLSEMSSGMRTIVLTIVISTAVAVFKPVKEVEDGEE